MLDLSELDVLIVDDHEPMRALLRKVLERAGFASIRTAAGAEEAFALLEDRPAQLILVDRNMPGLGGAAFIARVRFEPLWRDARIVMITGDARAEPAAGADATIPKPVSPRELLTEIARLFTR